ncbi:autotransporter outer membrane beta-barrel domain-containing protein, partial [Candidatus Hamiltonella defensa]
VSHQPQPSVKPQPESEINPKTRVTPSISPEVGAEIPASGEMVTSGSGSHRQAPVDAPVTETVVASRRMPGATVVPKTEQQPQPGIVAPAQINHVAQSALKPNASFGVHSPSPLPTVNTVTESEPIFSTTTLSTITIQGQKNHTFKKKSYHQGIEIKGQSTVGNTGDLSISTSHKNHPAVKVSEGSIVTLKGNDDKLLTLTTIGADSPGLLATDTDTEIIANKIDITTQGENSEGVKIVNDARVIINDSNITENGENAYGIWAEGEKTHLMANNVEIELNAQNATGIKAVNGGMVHIVESSVTANDDNSDGLITEGDKTNLRANDLEIEINGHNSTGVKALQGGAGIIENSSIIGHGNAFVGLSAAHEKTHLTGKNLNIEVQNGPKGTGVAAANGASIDVENGTIIGTGKDFIGLLAADQKTNLEVNQMSIQANAEDSQGVIAENGAKVTVENSSIIGNWENFDGLRSRGENANLTANNTKIELHRENSRGVNIENGAKVDIKNGSQIITRGASSPAIQLAQKGRLNVSDSAIKTLGKNSATFYVAPGSSDQKSVVEMTGGSLEASGDLISSQGGTMDVVLNKVSVSSPGSGYLLNVLNSDSGHSGEVNLSVLNPIGERDPAKTLRGNILTAEGSKANVSLKGSTLIGWAQATHFSLDPASTWSVTTGVSRLKELNNEGRVEFQPPSATSLHPMGAPVYTTLSLGSLSGTGMFWMNTDIAGHQGDFLNVTGKAKGDFGVMVADSGNSPTAEDSLKIIQTGGGDARFTLANEGGVVDVGTYQYYLVPDDRIGVPDDRNRVLDDRERGWSLVSHQPQIKTAIQKGAEPTPETRVTSSIPTEVAVVTPVSGKAVTKEPTDLTGPLSFSGSPTQAERMPESDRAPSVTLSSIETGAAVTPVSVATIDTPEVTQSPGLPIPQSVFLSSTAYNVDKIEPVLSKETIDGKENYILEEDYREGIEVKGQSTVTNSTLKNKKMLSVSSSHAKSPAVKASEGSTVTLNGNQDKLVTVRTSGNQSPGIQASGISTNITADKINIMTEGKSSEGVKADAGGKVIINNSIITGEGENFNKGLLASGAQSNLKGNNLAITINVDHGEGVIAEQGAEVTLEDSTINIEKDSVLNNGMTASGQNTHLKGNKLTMNVNGINGRGVNVMHGANVNIEDSRLTGKGTNFQGLNVDGYGTNLTANKINIEVDVGLDVANKIGAGVLATRAGKIDIKNSTITGKGTSFSVLRAEEDNAHLKGNNLTISVAGKIGTGITAKNGGTAVINDSTITSTEEDFVGLVAQNNSNVTGKNITIDASAKNGSGVTALINSHVNIKDTTIIGKGENFLGLASVGENANMTAERMEIELDGQNVTGVTAVNGAKVIINHSNITESGENAYGVLAAGDKSTLKADHLDIEANGGGSTGVKVINGAQVMIKDSSVTENGENAYGLSAEGAPSTLTVDNVEIEVNGQGGTGVKTVNGAKVSIENSVITGTEQDFLGILAHGDQSNLTAKKMTIEIKDKDSKAVVAEKGATVNIEDSRLVSEGDTFVGLVAYQDKSKLTGKKVNIEIKNGQKGKAVVADKGAQTSIENSTIISTGKDFLGLSASAEKSNLKAKKITMQVNGEQSKGAMAESGASLIIDDSTMIGNSTDFYGLWARGKNTNLTANNTNIALNGEDAKGITVQNEATVNINGSTMTTHQELSDVVRLGQKGTFKARDSHLKANGEGSAILYVEDPDNTKQKSVAEITRGSLESSKGSLIVSKGGTMDVVLNSVDISSPGNGYALKAIHGGEVNLEVNQTTLPGNIFVDSGSKANVTLKGSELSGWATGTNLSIDPESTWSITGDSGWKSLSHRGKIQFKSDTGPSVNPITSNRYSRLSLESLSGTGMFWMNTDIAGHKGDFLDVKGEANGQFDVMVTDSGNSPKAGDTLKIIETGGGAADFILANQGQKVDVGTYQYYLVPDELKRSWSLISHQGQKETATEQGLESHPSAPNIASSSELNPELGINSPSIEAVSAQTPISGETVPAVQAPQPSVETATRVLEAPQPGSSTTKPIVTQKRIFDDAQTHTLMDGSTYNQGIEVKNTTTVKNGGALLLSSTTENSPAVKVSEASTVTLTGAEDKLVTLTTNGTLSHGLDLSGKDTQVSAHKINITTNHDSSYGVKVDKGATFSGKHLKIENNAQQDGTGIDGRGAKKVNIEHSAMTGTGDDFFGLVAQYTELEGKNLEIDVKGKNGIGLKAFNAAKVNISGSKMTGEGDSFQGIWAFGERTDVTGTNLEIQAKGKRGKGVIAFNGAKVDIQGSTLKSDEEAFVGLVASEDKSNLMVNKTTIKANGQDSKGVKVEKGATVDIQESTINSTGENFDGLVADNAKLTGNKVTIDVKEGHKGRGVVARNHADVTILNDSKISGTGNDFLGLWAYGNQTNLEANHLTLEIAGQNGKGVSAQSEANVIINDSTMTSTGEAFVGLSALEKNTHLTSEKLKINLHAQKGKGIEVKEGANLTANHLNIETKAKDSTGVIALSEATVNLNNSTINAHGRHSLGLLASGDQTHLTGNQLNIQVDAQDSKAVKVEKGAKVDIQQGSTITGNGKNFYGLVATEDQSKLIVNQTTITANGQYGRGLQVVNGAEGMIEDSNITSTGENFHSLWADKSNLKGKKLTIESKGEKGRGVTARNEARVMINDSKITGKEKDFIGLWARGKNTYLTGKNLEIDVKNKYGKGVSAQNEAHLMIEESTINGNGEAFIGLMASKNTDVAIGHLRINLNGQRGKGVEVTQSAHLKADHIVINANAQDSAGIMALSDSMVNLNNSKIIGKDSLSLGLLASGDKTNITGNHINMELNGQNSLGVVVEKGATINMKDSTMTTLGVLSHAARLSKKGTLNVTDSRITTLGENSAILYVDSDDPKQKSAAEITSGFLEASGDLILSKGAALDVVLNNVAISSPGSGYALNVLNSDSGHPGNVNLVVNETTLPGHILTAKGSKAHVRLKRSELIGEVDATSLSVDADSNWTLTGNSFLKDLSHEGKIAFKPHNDMSSNQIKAIDYSTLYLDTLSGEGGTFWMNTDIAGHRGDFLNVRGEANGHFGVMVTDTGESPKAEDSLKIIQTGGGEAEFNLANPGKVVDVGTYQYHL